MIRSKAVRTCVALIFSSLGLSSLPAAEAWRVGDRVEVWNSAWYPAEILAIGEGEHAGQFRVHYEKFSAASDQWILAKNIRARADATPAKSPQASAGPRIGKYRVYSYGAAGNQLYLGEIELTSDGTYQASQPGGKSLGQGKYRFDAAKSTVLWLTGPYKDSEWGGGFEVSREGKTHIIRLRRNTIATNSVD